MLFILSRIRVRKNVLPYGRTIGSTLSRTISSTISRTKKGEILNGYDKKKF